MISSMLFAKYKQAKPQQGFSLIEMAIVLVILGMLLGGLMIPLSSQREVSQRQATERQLQEIRNALIGYAQAHNALPCPVDVNVGDVVPPVPTAATTCNLVFDHVPYAALGIQGTVNNRNLVDIWQNYIRYRLTDINTWSYAKTPIPVSPIAANQPDLQICNSSIGATLLLCGLNRTTATTVAAVVISIGEAHGSADEAQNTTNDRIFVMHTLEQNFDDIVVWISQPTLVYELSRTGR
jgi:prepilin-type N-terminal cleavage/methylation domain-containing protein